MFSVLRNPDIYHGNKKSGNYFEGWYFKLVEPKTGYTLALIPGAFKSSKEDLSHSFIQILNGQDLAFNYVKFPYNSFVSSNHEFKFMVDNNMFSLNKLQLDIKTPEISIYGSLCFYNIKKWLDTFINPGSMGFYNYLPFMQCYSQVCALSGSLKGFLVINGEKVSFAGGDLYIEKNWGRDFPYSWVWVQCNNFRTNPISLSCSIGHIPFPLGSFRGFLIGLYYNDVFYKFTTINRSKLNIEKQGSDVLIKTSNRLHTLTLKTHSSKDKFLLINGPRDIGMIPMVEETLSGELELTITDNANKKKVVEDYGRYVGIEYGGDQKMVIKDF